MSLAGNVGSQSRVSKISSKRWSFVIPVAAIMYMLAYLDRNNVAVILPFIGNDPTMQLTVADKGMVTGIFFVGYMFLQIPGAILAQKWSAKKVVLILMVMWGLAAMATGLVPVSYTHLRAHETRH